ncbi:LacI family DNA-binding transcriptional regulator [Micropruina sp.]|uniref:LacI family DNA-binding transcriptional regulator n=1 Tax=Micropruina sp. TaxID=2737536 RepID=UPI0039E6A236
MTDNFASDEMPPPSRRARRGARLEDVANRAGVSVATASRSLRGVAKVAPQTRARVLDAAHELDYAVSASVLAQRPEHDRRPAVAVIMPFFTRWYFSTATAAALRHLRDEGFDVLLYHLGSADVRDEFFERLPLAGRVQGIVSLSMPLREQHTLSLRALGLPLVSIGSHIEGWPSVGIDDVATARLAVNHLLNQGHERIGLIAGALDDARFGFTASMGRRLGYEQALNEAGIEFDEHLVVEGPHGVDGGAHAMSELLSRPGLPTAVLAEFDELAIGALWALRRAGLQVPRDVSVIGIDDVEMARFVDLTTVAQDVVAQGRLAAVQLLRQLRGESVPADAVHVLQPARLVLRDSTAPPHHARTAAASLLSQQLP